ncbi:MAG: HlyD family efflux transporter periplasmic adaptor subunit [Bryobacteraceae bacterium]
MSEHSGITQFEPLSSMRLVRTSPQARWLALGLTCAFAVAAAGLAFVPWQQNIGGSGRVVALTPVERQQAIDAPIEGRILRWRVTEGTKVKAGDPVAEIADNDPAILDRYRRERDAVQERLRAAQLREQSLGDRIGGLDGSRRSAIAAADSRVEMARERLRAAERATDAAVATQQTAKLNLDRQNGLHRKGLTPTRSVELAQLDYDRAVAEAERAKAALNSAKEEMSALGAERQKTETDFRAMIDDAKASRALAAAEIANAMAALQPVEMRLARQSTQSVTAPRDGVVLRLLAQPGSEVLKAGDPVAILVPESGKTVVELWVSGNDMPLVSAGDKVRLQFEGWPAIQFVGWPSVAVGTFGGEVTLVDATDNGQGKFRLLVAPDAADDPWPSQRYLRQGVRAHGWVLLRTVPLGFELWRQFNGFPPTIAQTEMAAMGKSETKK